jgi:hypothetical protein
MPHLEKLPTWFVKGDQRRAAYYTINARELIADGWTEEGEKAAPAPAPKPQPEILVEAGQDAFDDDSIKEPLGERLEEMTKAELLDWALDQGHDLKNALPKAEIFKLCKEIEEAL